jgi:hypothetical protein
MRAEQLLVEEGEDVVPRGVDVHAYLIHDHRLFADEVAPAQEGRQDEIGDDLERPRRCLCRHPGAVDRQLAVRGRVHAPAAALDRLREASGLGIALRPLEDKVLEKVREAGVVLVLTPRADADEDADRDRSGGRHRLGHHPQPVRQHAALVWDSRSRAHAPGGGAGRHLRPPRRRRLPLAT